MMCRATGSLGHFDLHIQMNDKNGKSPSQLKASKTSPIELFIHYPLTYLKREFQADHSFGELISQLETN